MLLRLSVLAIVSASETNGSRAHRLEDHSKPSRTSPSEMFRVCVSSFGFMTAEMDLASHEHAGVQREASGVNVSHN